MDENELNQLAQLRAEYIRALDLLHKWKQYTGQNLIVLGEIGKQHRKIVNIAEQVKALYPDTWVSILQKWNLKAEHERERRE